MLLAQCIVIGIVSGCIYILAALGWMIVFNVTRVLNFTQGEFVMLGGMLAVTAIAMGISPPIAFLIAIIITTLVGCIIERSVINTLRKAPDTTLMIATIGASLSMRIGALMIWGWEPRDLAPFTHGKPISLFGAAIVPQAFWVIGATLLLVTGLFFFYQYTLLGKALTATSIDQEAARLMGINPSKMSIIAFILASSLGAIGGILVTPIIMTSFDTGVMISVKALVAAVIGGFKPKGVLVVALTIGLIENIVAGFISSGWKDIFSLTIMVLVLVILIPKLVSVKA
jgi:branched-chain amino acid transport system permease protein